MSKKIKLCFLLFVFYGPIANGNYPVQYPIKVCFTPGEDCTAEIIHAIDTSKKSILVQAYNFTSMPIAKHLIMAKKRGVTVKVILDKSQKTQRYSTSRFLINQCVPCWIDYKPAIAHSKVMIIDQRVVITGSFNFTRAAQYKNAENLVIIQDPEVAKLYMKNWDKRKAASTFLNTS